MPDLDTVSIAETTGTLLVPQRPDRTGAFSSGGSDSRYSRNAAPVGRRAEEIAHRYITDHAAQLGARNVRWLAREGLTPGWDIQYEEAATGELVRVEVKRTAAALFPNVELTAGEWRAAEAHGDGYWLYLVVDCCGTAPRIQRLRNPTRVVAEGGALLAPVVYRLSLLGSVAAS